MKKLISVALAVVFAFAALAGCGSSASSGGNTTAASSKAASEAAASSAAADTSAASLSEEPAAEGETYKLRLSIAYPEDHADTLATQRACDAIREKTNGAVDITIFPNSILGDYTQIFEEVVRGTVDMAAMAIPSTYDSRYEIINVPYLVTDYASAIEAFSAGSYLYDQLEAINKENGVHTLNVLLDGFMGVGCKTEIENPMDYTAKHPQKIRVSSVDSYLWTAEAMGYSTATVPYSDLYSALQTGVVDGWVGGSAYVNWTSFGDVIKYFVDNRYIHELIITYINADLFNGMPEEYRKIIEESFAAEAVVVAQEREELDNQAMKDMEAAGITVYVPTDEEIQAMADYFHETVWPKFENALGKELLDGLIASVSK